MVDRAPGKQRKILAGSGLPLLILFVFALALAIVALSGRRCKLARRACCASAMFVPWLAHGIVLQSQGVAQKLGRM